MFMCIYLAIWLYDFVLVFSHPVNSFESFSKSSQDKSFKLHEVCWYHYLPHVLVQICSKADAIIGLDGQQIYWEQEEGRGFRIQSDTCERIEIRKGNWVRSYLQL